jgi:uncharacterized membrane protein YgcG
MKPILLTIALLFSTPAWANFQEPDKSEIFFIVGVLIFTLITFILASIHFLPKKLVILVFVSLVLVSSIIFYSFGIVGLFVLAMAFWLIGGLLIGKGDVNASGGDFGGGDGGGGGD